MKPLIVRPSKVVSVFSMIVGSVLFFMGVFVFIPKAGLFGVFWTLIMGGISALSAVNVFSKKGVAIHEIDVGDFSSDTSTSSKLSFDEKLRRLVELYKDGLITEEEFIEKRKKLMMMDEE